MKRIFSLILFILLLLGCSDEQASITGPETEREGLGKASVGTAWTVNADLLVSTEELAALLNDPAVVVVHVGDDAAYNAGHIPGARLLRWSALVTTVDGIPFELPDVEALEAAIEAAGISDDSRVILYGGWRGLQAARAFFTLDYLGHRNLALLDGGLEAWTAEARPTTTDVPPSTSGSFTPHERRTRFATAEWVQQRLDHPKTVLIDARDGASYAVDHLPGAFSIPWTGLQVNHPSDQRLRDAATLKSLFAAAGVEPGSHVTVYCWTGVMSSFAYFVARYLNLNVRLYDGSYLEWTSRGLPHES